MFSILPDQPTPRWRWQQRLGTWNLERGTWTIAGALLKRNKCLVTQRTRVLQVKWVLRWQDLLPSPSSARHFLIFRLGAHPKTARAFLKYPQSISLRGLPYLVRLHWRCTFVTLNDRSVWSSSSSLTSSPHSFATFICIAIGIGMGSTFYVLVSLPSVLNHRFGFVSGSVFGVSVACVLTVCLAGWQRGIAV